MWRIMKAIGGGIVVGMVLVVGSILVGRPAASPTRMQYFRLDVCQLPCWLGIRAGKTTLGEAWKRIRVSFPEPAYRTTTDGNYIWISDRTTAEVVTVRLNDPFAIDFQSASTLITQMDVWFGRVRPLTATELFALIGEPADIGIAHDLSGFGKRTYALYCNRSLRASPSQGDLTLASPQDDMASIEIYTTASIACNGGIAVTWQGFGSNYAQQVKDAYDLQTFGK